MTKREDLGILPSYIHPSWDNFLTIDILNELKDIEQQIGSNYTPSHSFVLRFLNTDLDKAKVVIIGQDPYKPEGIATGRAFQPSNLVFWHQRYRQVSLKNMIRLIYKSYEGIEEYSEIPNYSDILPKIASGEFAIKQPAEWFNSTEKQGVIWLNTTFTCKIGESNSHKGIWTEFTKELIKYISERNTKLCWFLWGKEAQSIETMVSNSKEIFKSNHPMMCSEKYTDDFLKCNCFRDTWSLINWLG